MVWAVLFIFEAFFIVVGNLFSILKFADSGQLHKRSTYLLINLAAADILVGACAVPLFVYLIGGQGKLWFVSYEPLVDVYTAIDVLSGLGSISSLTLVSLERLSATLWPLRHRTLRVRVYLIGITSVWVLTCSITASGMIIGRITPSKKILFYFSVFVLAASCLTIFVTNLTIWIYVSRHRPGLSHHRNAARTQERRLTVTLLIVTLVSLSAWLPFAIINIVNNFQPLSLNKTLIYASKLLHYGNSGANVFVYTRRIAEFRYSLEKICCCHSSLNENTEAVVLQARVVGISKETTRMETGVLMSRLLTDDKTRKGQYFQGTQLETSC